VVAEVNVKDRADFDENFLKGIRADNSQHGGEYLAGGYDKTLSLVGPEPPNRVVILQFANRDAVKEWRKEARLTWRTRSAANTPPFVSMPLRA
jgi:uncharacterized protein (DUF1330 family)